MNYSDLSDIRDAWDRLLRSLSSFMSFLSFRSFKSFKSFKSACSYTPELTGDPQGGDINIGLNVVGFITNATFENNSARDGGAISLSRPEGGGRAIESNNINNVYSNNINNVYSNNNNDVFLIYEPAGIVSITNSVFLGNTAADGGALSVYSVPTTGAIPFQVTNCKSKALRLFWWRRSNFYIFYHCRKDISRFFQP